MNDSLQYPSSGTASPKFRQDIEWIYYPDTRVWVARDPLTASYFTFSPIERTAAILLDGRRSFAAVLATLRRDFPHGRISEDWLQILARKCKLAHLLMPEGAETFVRRTTPVFQFLVQLLVNPLAIKLPLLRIVQEPKTLYWFSKFLFNRTMLIVVLFAGVLTSFLVIRTLLQHPISRNTEWRPLNAEGWIAILLSYLAIKSLHELGHVLACFRFRARCKEIGILFLFFTPCLYCDTTDSWKLASKWKRAAIGMAGIYIEIMIAIAASLIWLNSHEGLVQTIAASSMMICTLGTILVNGNPFFRYDGYYVLSDVWGVPNLSEQSARALRNVIVEMLGGRRLRRDEYDRSPRILATFAAISLVYRYMMLFLILWMVWSTLVPRGLGFIAILILASSLVGIVMYWRRSADAMMSEFYAPQPIRLGRVLFGLAILVGGLVFAASVPISGYSRSRAFLEFHDCVPMYAREQAKLVYMGDLRNRFPKDEILFEFESPERQVEEIELRGEIESTKNRIDLLRKSAIQESSASYEIPTQEALLSELESRYALLKPQLESLKQQAPFSGNFVSTSASQAPFLSSPTRQNAFNPLLNPSRIGSWVEKGTLLGHFTDHQGPVLKALVQESDMKLLRMGSTARCVFDSCADRPIECKIVRLAPEPVSSVPNELATDPFFLTVRDENGALTTLQPHYEVQLEPQVSLSSFNRGAIATVQFRLPARTIFEQLYRVFRLTFRFDNS